MGDLSKHFDNSEMRCKCGCGQIDMDYYGLLTKLDLARDIAGIPFIINSGYRCDQYNTDVGGKPGSAHTKGMAVDIKADNSRKRFRIINGLLEAGFSRLGIDFDRGFIHVDSDDSKDQEVVWGY